MFAKRILFIALLLMITVLPSLAQVDPTVVTWLMLG